MTFRKTLPSDLENIKRINQQEFIFTPGELSLVDGVILDDFNQIISFGIVKPMAEATFITDTRRPQKERVLAMKQMMDLAVVTTKDFGIKQLHTFVEDPRLARALQKHYGFIPVTGTVLVKNL